MLRMHIGFGPTLHSVWVYSFRGGRTGEAALLVGVGGMNGRSGYHPGFQVLHWLMALLIVVAWVVGLTMGDMERGPQKAQVIGWHMSLGVTLIALLVGRIVWRLVAGAPPLPDGTPLWSRAGAKVGHALLYALLLAVPVVGVILGQAQGRTVGFWGLVALPSVIAPDRALGHDLEELHETLANVLMIVAALHALVAVYHQAVLKDGLLGRMVPWRTPSL